MIASLFAQVPFDQYRVIDTDDFDEAHPHICQALNSAKFQVLSGAIQHNLLDLLPCGHLSLIKLRYGYGAEVSVDPGCLKGYFLLVLPTQGKAEFHFDGRRIEVSPREAFIISPDKRFHFRASHDYEQVLLRLNRHAMDDAWCRLTAQDHAPSLFFDAVISLHSPGWQALIPMLQWVGRCANLGQGNSPAQAALLAQTEVLLATTLLLHQPHNMAAQLWPAPPPSASSAIRRAQAYMLEHSGERLPVAAVASHCGLSVRRLQALFQDECRLSPLQWLRHQRLLAARLNLQTAERNEKIADVAMRYGFSHLGEFSQAYREAFGETPQQTRKS